MYRGWERLSRAAPGLRPRVHRWLVRTWYSLISTRMGAAGHDVTFLNYGFAALDGRDGELAQLAHDGSDVYAVQLYHRVAGARDLRGRDVLEVGCGRGGGTAYIARRLGPRRVTGVDLAAPAVAFCRRRHRVDGLVFLAGNAEDLPFAPASFDVVVNVESSHCYASFGRFLQEVSRVLRPGGEFLFADVRPAHEVPTLRRDLQRAFAVVEEECMTPQVFRALTLDSERRNALIRARAPALLQQAVRTFAAVEGTATFEAFRRRDLEYFRFVLRKQERTGGVDTPPQPDSGDVPLRRDGAAGPQDASTRGGSHP